MLLLGKIKILILLWYYWQYNDKLALLTFYILVVEVPTNKCQSGWIWDKWDDDIRL